ncbi:hypothetical protein DFJ77DRAFT_440533 [Powellomyces hirtus]|nr:hypothetical protein DFJ77DRAFT_440533 [Powellomyces hirtus]
MSIANVPWEVLATPPKISNLVPAVYPAPRVDDGEQMLVSCHEGSLWCKLEMHCTPDHLPNLSEAKLLKFAELYGWHVKVLDLTTIGKNPDAPILFRLIRGHGTEYLSTVPAYKTSVNSLSGPQGGYFLKDLADHCPSFQSVVLENPGPTDFAFAYLVEKVKGLEVLRIGQPFFEGYGLPNLTTKSFGILGQGAPNLKELEFILSYRQAPIFELTEDDDVPFNEYWEAFCQGC